MKKTVWVDLNWFDDEVSVSLPDFHEHCIHYFRQMKKCMFFFPMPVLLYYFQDIKNMFGISILLIQHMQDQLENATCLVFFE